MKKIFSLIILILFLCCTGCQNEINGQNTGNEIEKEKIKALVSILPQKTFLEAVGGDLVEVSVLIPPGYSPSNYEPTSKQMAEISDAELYFTIGVPAEAANIIPNLLENQENIKIVELAKAVDEKYNPRIFGGENGNRDPHIWMSPKRVEIMVEQMAETLIEKDPDNKEIYKSNMQAYIEKLDLADANIRQKFANKENKSFIITHPSLGYFADDYGLEMIAMEKDGKEITASFLQDIIDFAKENNIKIVFYQAEFDSTSAQILADEIGGKTMEISALKPDYLNNILEISEIFVDSLK